MDKDLHILCNHCECHFWAGDAAEIDGVWLCNFCIEQVPSEHSEWVADDTRSRLKDSK